jgi:ribosome biogenesis GTPase / thiamine phosphate phosphatase
VTPLEGLGWDDGWAEAAHAVAPPGADPRPGRVVRTHRIGFDVLTRHGREAVVHRAAGRDPLAAPATGDWVLVHQPPDEPQPVIAAVLERRTALVRRDPADRAAPQVLAANADVVAVVQGADRPVNARRLERQLALAHGSGGEVVVILTKADVEGAADAEAAVRAAAPAARLLVTAAHAGEGVPAVDALTDPRRTLVLLGESGAGKSSLVNAVLGHEVLAIGGVREGDRKGRHTTTRRELVALPTGGALLDTPGVRAVGLWPDATDLDAAFPEVAAAAEACRFADCRHDAEPACGVRAALGAGGIAEDRLQAWLQLAEELEATRTAVERAGWR